MPKELPCGLAAFLLGGAVTGGVQSHLLTRDTCVQLHVSVPIQLQSLATQSTSYSLEGPWGDRGDHSWPQDGPEIILLRSRGTGAHCRGWNGGRQVWAEGLQSLQHGSHSSGCGLLGPLARRQEVLGAEICREGPRGPRLPQAAGPRCSRLQGLWRRPARAVPGSHTLLCTPRVTAAAAVRMLAAWRRGLKHKCTLVPPVTWLCPQVKCCNQH